MDKVGFRGELKSGIVVKGRSEQHTIEDEEKQRSQERRRCGELAALGHASDGPKLMFSYWVMSWLPLELVLEFL